MNSVWVHAQYHEIALNIWFFGHYYETDIVFKSIQNLFIARFTCTHNKKKLIILVLGV